MKSKLMTLESLLFCAMLAIACSKNDTPEPDPGGGGGGGNEPPVVVPVTDPAVAETMGFFLDNNWLPRTFTAPAYTDATPVTTTTVNSVTIDASAIITKIPLSIFGHNANAWMGEDIAKPIVIDPVKNLNPHIIRFPAGSGSDVYFFNRTDGDLPPDAPAQIMDKDGNIKSPGHFFGKSTQSWQASLDQYYTLLQQSNSKGMITINYGYARYGTSDDPVAAAAHLAADWVRYDNGRTPYWEIGNETYGDWEWGYRIDQTKNKDGQPEYVSGGLYGQHFQVFADSMRKAAVEIDKTIYIGATLIETPPATWATNVVKTWNSTLIPALKGKNDFFIAHNYFTNYGENSNASQVLIAGEKVPYDMMNFLKSEVLNNGGTLKPVALTEWNMWALGSKQQVSNTSGLFALLVVGESLKNKFGMAARWDLVNGWDNGNDHGLFSPGDEPGIPKWSPRPSFHYLYFFQKLMGDRLVPAAVSGTAAIKAYASTYSSGQANCTILNTSASAVTVEIKSKNFNIGSRFYYYTLEGSNDNGEFSRKVIVNGSGPTKDAGGPADYATLKARSSNTLNGVKVVVPAYGAVMMVIDKK
ncbi:hypothetical protein [Flavihumibacter petaseus]|uniref:Putative glycosidase n=1 Tax=Flavihumibacter petaseus NBRC 106054 TaxID=1220578 RepID=A0A0E9N4A0_9BACT|nr:hypothetical protein [Flavihumibacter petaseus]GAO44654.1 putative glycosidase [Flavihumibacter petaseus NBRC 106054]